ncbi:chromate transporter [Histoplasma capsulatum var. duboisii H88]|uniref:Chromate transporter n=1 Tax=Ajellomyces capsulatus (strain H88) TaxID=544711 RepID=F0UKZ5_AJEC8|nr:chromate transporter [Histoplasma capsulatum var. duboisii H88]
MPLDALFRGWYLHYHDSRAPYEANNEKLTHRFLDVIHRNWHLGFTSFGGPPVHFRIFYQKFVEDQRGITPWIDEQTYQELFALCQALPGPGSTKMIFCIVLIHAGFLPALLAFMMWSLPGAIGMYGLSLGVQRIAEVLPEIVYAFLSGLNASTVGIITFAAVQLAEKAIKDPLTRILVIIGGCAGLCFNALWYFPLLIIIGGICTMSWDLFGLQNITRMRRKLRRRMSDPRQGVEESVGQSITLRELPQPTGGVQKRSAPARNINLLGTSVNPGAVNEEETNRSVSGDTRSHKIPTKWGILIIVGFFGNTPFYQYATLSSAHQTHKSLATFIAILVARGVVQKPPLELDLFASMYLAGTIIFGGGPVVIPLLREYVVGPGWVSPRDFLVGLAIIQAFPGPNFNFAVYLGALALAPSMNPTILGAFLGFLGIFVPGITLAVGFQSIWRSIRTIPFITSLLRGINATAVGLVFTAVYRLWEIGYLSADSVAGQSLGKEPFWLVVAAISYAGNAWFKVPPAAVILMGGVLGLCWYGVVGR